jgi:GntR family transcriptional regulator
VANLTWNALPLDRHSPIPLYQQLSEVLVDKISNGILKPGDHLPSENELMDAYGVSRYVVRQTLTDLSRQGLIYTEHGRGSYVSPKRIEKPLDVLQSYHESMRRHGFPVEVKILKKELVYPEIEIARLLDVTPNQRVLSLVRVGYLDGSPTNILSSYIVAGSWASEQKLLQFSGGSLYGYLKEQCGVSLTRSHGHIEVIFAGEYESRLLNISRSSVLLAISSVVYEQSGRPIEHARVIYPGAMFRFEYDSFVADQSSETQRAVVSPPTTI